MKRKIIHIHEDKCNGCGLCVDACHERAIEMVDGVAKLVSDEYCDGLGDCLPECPTGAIELIERAAAPFNEEAVQQRMAEYQKQEPQAQPVPFVCPGNAMQTMKRPAQPSAASSDTAPNSELRQWPVQLSLVNPKSEFFNDAHVLLAADCVAYAYANFHRDFIKDRITVIGCPKLDDISFYQKKLTEIILGNSLKSLTVVRMEVPCCGGIVQAAKQALLQAGTIIPYQEVTISLQGGIVE